MAYTPNPWSMCYVDNEGRAAPIRQHELIHTDLPERSRPSSGAIGDDLSDAEKVPFCHDLRRCSVYEKKSIRSMLILRRTKCMVYCSSLLLIVERNRKKSLATTDNPLAHPD